MIIFVICFVAEGDKIVQHTNLGDGAPTRDPPH